MIQGADPSLSKRLKAQTHSVHARLDTSVMAAAMFDDLAGYARFVAIQFGFHRDIDALYGVAALAQLLPDLAARRRLALIAADLADLGIALPDATAPAFAPGAAIDVAYALGWLYVAEGSSLGAAVLRKEAAKLGLSDTYGARHLAPALEGAAAHWRAFTTALDAIAFTAEQQDRAVAGANAAFARVQSHVDAMRVLHRAARETG